MAWYDNFPTSGGSAWYDNFPGGGAAPAAAAPPSLAGLYQPYTPSPMSSYPAMQALQFQFPAAGSGGASLGGYAPFSGLGASSFGGYTGGPAFQQSYGGFPQFASPQGFGAPQGLGGYGQSLGGGSLGGYGGLGQQGAGQAPQMPGLSPAAQRAGAAGGGPQMPQGYGGMPQGYSGGTSNPAALGVGGGAGASGFVSPVPDGGVYGAQKWSTPMGSNAVDIFVRRGTPVRAPVSGTLQMGQNGQLILIGDNGTSFAFRHGQTTAQGHVQAGQQIGVVNDPGMDTLGRPGFGNMPDGYQHLELSVSNGNYFPMTPGGGGSIDAAQWLESIGYRGTKMQRTPGPPDAQGGGGMGMGMGQGGFGQGGFPGMSPGGFPGMPGGFPGMQGGFNPAAMFGQGGLGGLGQGGFGQGGMNPLAMLFGGMR